MRAAPRRVLDRHLDVFVAIIVAHDDVGNRADRSRTDLDTGIACALVAAGGLGPLRGGARRTCDHKHGNHQDHQTTIHASSTVCTARGAYCATRTLIRTRMPPTMTTPLTRSPRSNAAATKVTSGSAYSSAATRETSIRSNAPYQKR